MDIAAGGNNFFAYKELSQPLRALFKIDLFSSVHYEYDMVKTRQSSPGILRQTRCASMLKHAIVNQGKYFSRTLCSGNYCCGLHGCQFL
jgi:hypothetical protein